MGEQRDSEPAKRVGSEEPINPARRPRLQNCLMRLFAPTIGAGLEDEGLGCGE